ncbi:MAG: hypothetical protein ACI8XO_005042, partial [Verrucomicrobiales bacterium]
QNSANLPLPRQAARRRIELAHRTGSKGLSVNNSYNLLVILAITRVSFQLK